MNLLLHLSRQLSAKGRGTVFLILNFSFVIGVLKVCMMRLLACCWACGSTVGLIF